VLTLCKVMFIKSLQHKEVETHCNSFTHI